jgi:hypothetical protein
MSRCLLPLRVTAIDGFGIVFDRFRSIKRYPIILTIVRRRKQKIAEGARIFYGQKNHVGLRRLGVTSVEN